MSTTEIDSNPIRDTHDFDSNPNTPPSMKAASTSTMDNNQSTPTYQSLSKQSHIKGGGASEAKHLTSLADTSLQTHPDPKTPIDTTEVFHDFESALHAVGGFGHYQILFIFIVQWCITQFAGNFVIMPLATYVPHVQCQYNQSTHIHNASILPDVSGGNYGAGGGTSGGKSSVLELRPFTQRKFCAEYEAGECANVTWKSEYFYTIIEEWSLICSRAHVPELINSIQTTGNFLALLLVGILSDHYGRKNVFCVCFMVLMIANPLSAAVHSWPLFAALRCVVGAMVTATATVLFVWAMESVDMQHNVIMNIFSMWHLGYVISSLIGYCTRSWRPFLVVVNIIGAPILLVLMSLADSPRWLLQTGRIEQAAASLSFIARLNGRRLKITPESLENIPRPSINSSRAISPSATSNTPLTPLTHRKRSIQESGCNFFKLFESRQLAIRTLLITLLNIAISCTSATYLFQVSLFSGDPITKFLIFGLLRLATVPVVYLLDSSFKSWGRREMIYVPFTFVFCCLLAASASRIGLLSAFIERRDLFEFYLLLSAAVCCNFLWVGTGQYTMELFPTMLRNSAASFTTLFDPIGVILVQQLVYLETTMWRPILFVSVAVITGCACLAAFCLLPETKGQPLPDAIGPIGENVGNEIEPISEEKGNGKEPISGKKNSIKPVNDEKLAYDE